MGEMTWWEICKGWISGAAFRVFLWANSLTEQEYFDKVYFVEWEIRNGARP